jgi:hypothetical protein
MRIGQNQSRRKTRQSMFEKFHARRHITPFLGIFLQETAKI